MWLNIYWVHVSEWRQNFPVIWTIWKFSKYGFHFSHFFNWGFPTVALTLTPCHFLSPWEPLITATHQLPHLDFWPPSFHLSSPLCTPAPLRSRLVRLSPQPSSTDKISECAHVWVINAAAGVGASSQTAVSVHNQGRTQEHGREPEPDLA